MDRAKNPNILGKCPVLSRWTAVHRQFVSTGRAMADALRLEDDELQAGGEDADRLVVSLCHCYQPYR
jgi:hypothetical protein